ncbi:flagellar hook-length control protein FliK [Sphingomonas sp. Leaf21]|uniref:flagellar hook-length control protein FliK n=1 Tax=Sphingomonas sp. Leaf21 TaxID=2876550 RepID=UPI001E53A2BE|nr:flagellar hook-length control protein FliK [Sphingomonas sp. Leaf21]
MPDGTGLIPVTGGTGDTPDSDAKAAADPGNGLPTPLPIALPPPLAIALPVAVPVIATPPVLQTAPPAAPPSTSTIAVAVSTVAADAVASPLPMKSAGTSANPPEATAPSADSTPLDEGQSPVARSTPVPVPMPVQVPVPGPLPDTVPVAQAATPILTPGAPRPIPAGKPLGAAAVPRPVSLDTTAILPRTEPPAMAPPAAPASAATPLVRPSDTAMVDALARTATPSPQDGATPLPPNGQGFRLVMANPQVEAVATPTAILPALPSGPLTVRQPAQGAPVIGLLATTLRSLSVPADKADEAVDRPASPMTGAIDPATLASAEGVRAVVASTPSGDSGPLDMTQHHWPQAMIDRIDRMREDAATADTRIQLSPDALGGIAVAIRRDDDHTHLHFIAEQAQTATILADAHATLSRLAEDKGMRLGSMAVNAGASGGADLGQSARDQRPAAPPAPVQPTRPRMPDAEFSRDGATGTPAAAASTRIA